MIITHINIEPTNYCQLNCKFCGDRKVRQCGFMLLDEYKKILDMIGNVEVRLFLSGEPFIHPHIVEMIELALKDHPVLIHSNGIYLPDIPNHENLTLRISLVSNIDIVIRNVEKLKKKKDKVDIAYYIIKGKSEGLDIPDYIPEGAKCITRYAHNWDVKDSIEDSVNEKFDVPCGFLVDSLPIYWNGDVPICCADLNGRFIVGNIFKDGLVKIVEKFNEYAKLQTEGKDCPPCRGCERYEKA